MRRRDLYGLLLLAWLCPIAPARAALTPARATAFIQAAGEELVAVINDRGLSTEERRQRVAAILRRSVDIEGVGRFVLGRFWRQASPAEQAEYLRLFEESLIRNLAGRFGELQGVAFTVERNPRLIEEDVVVATIVTRPGQPPVTLEWRVAEVGGQPRIVDLIAEGASLRLTQRSEYAAVITRGGNQVSALNAALRRQLGQ
ncbi:MAG: ABC transporter substrate-binding protein [Rhodovarius sp.]|nr:ABC transporter substrate-binding protein [Rhodovarius sp.]